MPLEAVPAPPATAHHVLLLLGLCHDDEPAVQLAIRIARRDRAILTMALASREGSRAWYPAYGGMELIAARREAQVLGEQHLAAARDEVPADVCVRTVCLSGPGDPCRRIRAYAAAHGVDLVVSGRPRGRVVTHRLESGPVPVRYPATV